MGPTIAIRELGLRVGDSLLHRGDAAEDHERDTVDPNPLRPGNKRMGELVHEGHRRRGPGRRLSRGRLEGMYPASGEGGIDRDLVDLPEHIDSESDLAADDPGKKRDHEKERVMDQDRNPEYAPDPNRSVHMKDIFF